MVYKIGFIAIGIFLFAFGTTYLFNHVDPWLSQLVMWMGIIIAAASIYSLIKKQLK